ncbi:MAG: lipoprotein signal peptidase [Bacteroidales bacterium]|nr:lipoprotein signal peptidase [Bacteroidales bacterium]
MKLEKKQAWLAVAVVLLLIIIDQYSKIYVKTHFSLGEDVPVFGLDWWRLKFIENDGMAFGMEFGSKLFLTLFRVFASGAMIWYIGKRIKSGIKTGFLLTLTFILAGAVGNIIDCMFYGLIFSESPLYGPVASWVDFGEGYGSFMHGKVVDMFYFPLFEFDWPSWIPFIGGKHFEFFSAIFNFADACITCGVFAFLLFYRNELSQKVKEDEMSNEEESDEKAGEQ